MTIERLQSVFLGIMGLTLLLLAWEVIGHYQLVGITWPALSDVLSLLFDPARRGLFERALTTTLAAASQGYLIGGVMGLGLAVIAHLSLALRLGIERFSAFLNAIPPIALGPVFLVLLSRDATPVGISAINVFFIIFVSASSGLRTVPESHRDLFSVFGASSAQRLVRLEFPAALPVVVSGLKLAVPAALIGTIIGEWFGATRGLGVLIVNAMQNFQISLLWSAVLLVTCMSLALYLMLTVLERSAYKRFR
ncbi:MULTISPECIES: ABC transporter permease [Halomonadaceae]|uniref:ABC transporter permease n=1 Tax=Halomonadaceae TaxID=28256 RepID=UPI00159986EC|nr:MULTISPECIES: ABC transporter permease subunit [Halomonas]QJQ94841.1 ABC transporter permease subunit [Halomonas sp. PA5]